MVGIENLKKDLGVLIGIAQKVSEALEDGKVNIFEGIGLAITAVKAWKITKDYDELKAEYEDLDEDEILELHTYFVAEFDLANDKIENIIEQAFLLLLNMKNIVGIIK